MRDPLGAHFPVLKVLFDCFHTIITDVRYCRQPADSYSPLLPNECIDAVTVLACYGSPRLALMRFIPHCFPSLFKHTAPLTDTNMWQCLLTILPLQSWTDFWRFTTFFHQEFDYNALFHTNVYLHFAHVPHNWQNCAGQWVTLQQCFHLPHITTLNRPRCIFELRTNFNSYLPVPRISVFSCYSNCIFLISNLCHVWMLYPFFEWSPARKIQMPGNHPKERIQHNYVLLYCTYLRWFSSRVSCGRR